MMKNNKTNNKHIYDDIFLALTKSSFYEDNNHEVQLKGSMKAKIALKQQ